MTKIDRLSAFLGLFLLLGGGPSSRAEPSVSGKSFDLTPIILEDKFWTLDKTALVKLMQSGPFRWVSKDQREIRGAGAPLSFNGFPVLEVVFRFNDQKLSEVYLSLFNRGDNAQGTPTSFAELTSQVERMVGTLSGAQGEDLEETPNSTRIRNHSKIWLSPSNSFRLDTGFSKLAKNDSGESEERPEFINLTLLPGGLRRDDLVVQRQVAAASINLPDRIKHLDNGDVLLSGIPMVDQGDKGYCAVATMERILRYYGCEVNEHELAQQANSSGKGGTDPASLVKAIRAMGSTTGLHLREFQETKGFFEFVQQYNRAAKKMGKAEINLPSSGTIEIYDVFRKMDVEVLREFRLKDSNLVDRFFGSVTEAIDQGEPLTWGVTVGWVKENPDLKQMFGGHMRMIIGYNPTPDKREILYSDSWGYGHELKRMSLEDAYMITSGLYLIEAK